MAEEGAPQESQAGLTRRQFLQATATSAAGAIAFVGCQPPRQEFIAQSRVALAEDILSAYENWYATTCRQCPAGCGTIVRLIEGRAKKIEGNPDHPVNLGKLCARGQASVQEQYHPDRIQGPMRRTGERGSGSFTPISWDEALNQLVGRLREVQQRGRSREVTLVTGPFRAHRALLLDRFTRAYGSEWLTLNLFGEAPLQRAVNRAFGQSMLPEFDIQNARYVLSFGSDFLGPWLSQVHHSVEYGIFRQGDYRAGRFRPRQASPRGYLVQVEPHFSATAAAADEWAWVPPGAEGVLALGIAQVLLSEGLADPAGARIVGGTQAFSAYTPERVARDTGLPPDRIRQLARDFASRRPSLAIGGGTASAQTNGTDALTAILALNLLAGNVGKTGGVLLNPAPPIEGLPASPRGDSVAEWQRFAERLRSGSVQAVLLKDANPVYSAPAALGMREALLRADFLVSFSSFNDETTALADLVLPSHLPLEDWGDDVPDPGPGFQVLTIQQPVVRPAYDTRSFWDLLLVLAEELGGTLRRELPWRTFKDVLREEARLLQQERRGSVREAEFEQFWVRLLQQGGWWDEARTGSVPAEISAPEVQRLGTSFRGARFEGDETTYPFHLVLFPHNSLGSGETAHLPWLQGAPDPISSAVWQTWAEINPRKAAEMGLAEGDVVAIESPNGRRVEAPVYIHPAAAPTVIAMPLGQGHNAYGRWAEGRGANPLDLVAPLADDATGALAYGATRVRVRKTGRRATLPKFEGTAAAVQLPSMKVLKVTRE